MIERYEQDLLALESWAQSSNQAGWLPQTELAALDRLERQQAEALFAQQGQRPLIVAFFGGTGVGKSSLLNRLAGLDIARVGVERPTSREATLYLHRDYRIGNLPEELPMDETRIEYHDDDSRRLIAWLDMPDIDSVVEQHRELVEAWLPYVDWLIYVVSPERYQDDLGWRFLQQRGNRHSWLFVINHWDQGNEAQADQLYERLITEGFSEPRILRTCCLQNSQPDQFSRLEEIVNQAIRSYGLELLQQLGIQARHKELNLLAAHYAAVLDSWRLETLQRPWEDTLNQHLEGMGKELLLNADLITQPLKDNQTPGFRKARSSAEALQQLPDKLPASTWNRRIDIRMDTLILELQQLLQDKGIPVSLVEKAFDDFGVHAVRERFLEQSGQTIAMAVARPGTILTRGLSRLLNWLTWLLPLLASAWAIVHLVTGFYGGTRYGEVFLGIDFAVHALLLILLSWLIPWLLSRRLEPSPAASAGRGLKRSIGRYLDDTRKEGGQLLQHMIRNLQDQQAGLASIRDGMEKDAPVSAPLSGSGGGS